MKTIFTYPNNSPEYIDPDYLGDVNSGFYQRVGELKDGDYLPWTGLSPTGTTDEIVTGLGKYNNMTGLEESNGTNTFYKFHQTPLVEFTFRQKAVVIASLSVQRTGNDFWLVANCAFPHLLTSGTRVYGASFVTQELNDQMNPPAPTPNECYVQVDTATQFRLSADAAGNLWYLSFLDDTIYNQNAWGVAGTWSARSRTIRRDVGNTPGSLIKLNNPPPDTWDLTYPFNNQYLQVNLNQVFSSNPLDPSPPTFTGTLNTTADNFYIGNPTGSIYSWVPYIDAALTIPATINEALYTTATKTYTTAGTFDLRFEAYNSWGISTAVQNLLNSEVSGWARIYATVRDGGFTGQSSAVDAIPLNGPDYTYEFYWVHDQLLNTHFTMYDQRQTPGGAGLNFQDFILTDLGSGVDVDITIEFINPAVANPGWGQSRLISSVDAGGQYRDDPGLVDYEIDTANIILPGVEQFQYQDTNNQTQNGAVYVDGQWDPGGTFIHPLDPNNELMPADSTITLDSNGRLSGFNFPNEISDDRGQFTTNEPRLFQLASSPNTYVPPVPTPAELEDVWDTEDEWEDYGFAGGQKEWPSHVTPSKADIVYNAPTIVNNSQNGIKYTRSVGHTDWRLDVAYPPMTYDEFQKFHAIAQAAQGQAMPFFFKLNDKNGQPILWKKFEYKPDVSTNEPRFKDAVALGDRLALLEGFTSNETNAFIQGEVFIDGNNDNGYVHTVLNQVDANVYGEAKIRTPWPFRTSVNAGEKAYKEPAHIVVTLANDNFEYKVDTAGYYYMSVSFDLDDWKTGIVSSNEQQAQSTGIPSSVTSQLNSIQLLLLIATISSSATSYQPGVLASATFAGITNAISNGTLTAYLNSLVLTTNP